MQTLRKRTPVATSTTSALPTQPYVLGLDATADMSAPGSGTSLADQTYVQLREALMSGLFEPGEQIVVQALADQFGTSVMPVREAVARLAAERALEIVSGRSARVPELLKGQRFIELCEVRKVMEGHAASLAAVRATPSDLREILRCHRSTEAAMRKHDVDAALRSNRELHFAIYRSAHQEVLRQMIEALWLQCGPYFRAVFKNITNPEGRGRQSSRHHQNAVDAIKRRDADGAGLAVVEDIEESASWYRRAFAVETASTNPGAHPAKGKRTRAKR